MNVRFEQDGVRFRLSPEDAARLARHAPLEIRVTLGEAALTLSLAPMSERTGVMSEIGPQRVAVTVGRDVVAAVREEGEWRGRDGATWFTIEIDRHGRGG